MSFGAYVNVNVKPALSINEVIKLLGRINAEDREKTCGFIFGDSKEISYIDGVLDKNMKKV